jgi:hypothetical protein
VLKKKELHQLLYKKTSYLNQYLYLGHLQDNLLDNVISDSALLQPLNMYTTKMRQADQSVIIMPQAVQLGKPKAIP